MADSQPAQAATVHQIRISLDHSSPEIWRRIQVPSNVTLGDLHVVIQVAMGWFEAHLHNFSQSVEQQKQLLTAVASEVLQPGMDISSMTGQITRPLIWAAKVDDDGQPLEADFLSDAEADEDAVTVKEVLPLAGHSIQYLYDFGDAWQHTVTLEKVLPVDPDTKYPTCLAGERACPPEDCGGVPGYERLLEVIGDTGHDEHAETLEWLGDDFDPEEFDLEDTNAVFEEFPDVAEE